MPFPVDKDILDYLESNSLAYRCYSTNADVSNPVMLCQFVDKTTERVLSLSADGDKPVWGIAGENKLDSLRKAYAVLRKVGIQREGTVQVAAKEYDALTRQRDDLAAQLAKIRDAKSAK